MFPVRGLLQDADCPDHLRKAGGCERLACPFRHAAAPPDSKTKAGVKRRSSVETASHAEGAGHRDVSGRAKVAKVEKERIEGSASSSIWATSPGLARLLGGGGGGGEGSGTDGNLRPPRNAYALAEQRDNNRSALSNSNSNSKTSGGVRPSSASHQDLMVGPSGSSTTSDSALSAPVIARASHPNGSSVPLSTRQSSLRTYFVTFTNLYAPLLPSATSSSSSKPSSVRQTRIESTLKRLVHRVSSEDALASELDVFRTSNTSALTYRNSVRTTLVGLARRQKEDQEAQTKGDRCMGTIGVELERQAANLYDDLEELQQDQKVRHFAMERSLLGILRSSNMIGSPAEAREKQIAFAERVKGRLTCGRLESEDMLANEELLRTTQYPLPPAPAHVTTAPEEKADKQGDSEMQACIEKSWGPGSVKADREGEEVQCERCNVTFVVKALEADSEERQACCYHWGRRRYVQEGGRLRGPRVPRWTCCHSLDEGSAFASTSTSQIAQNAGLLGAGSSSTTAALGGSAGCVRGPHVFKEEATEQLHLREAFKSTETVMADQGERDEKHTYEVLAFDCELVYTTAGMSLARLTVLEEGGKVVLDRFVQPRATILDYNTRFSGITQKNMPLIHPDPNTAFTLEQARAALVTLMRPSSILVGHGLENDLKAVRLVHRRIIDSVFLYPHSKGLPFRMSLRELTRIHLGRLIQLDNDVDGHDAEEDARAALELIRLYYRTKVDAFSGKKSDKPVSVDNHANTSVKPSTPTNASAVDNVHQRPTTTPANSSRAVSGPSAGATASLFLPRSKRK